MVGLTVGNQGVDKEHRNKNQAVDVSYTLEVWKIMFLSKWLISRFQPLIFQGVNLAVVSSNLFPRICPRFGEIGVTFKGPYFHGRK